LLPAGSESAGDIWSRGRIRQSKPIVSSGPSCAKAHHDECRVLHFRGDIKMNKRNIVLSVLAIALFAAWYAFRPERLFINQTVDEGFPAAEQTSRLQAVESGSFYGVAHPTSGTATIYRMADGDRILRFTNFKTSNGPDVHVYLVAADDARDSETVKRSDFIDLGNIKGNMGDQNYALARDLDLSKYRTVSIWCKRFAVNFGAAPLRAGEATVEN
jgi:Electron transfer DM13